MEYVKVDENYPDGKKLMRIPKPHRNAALGIFVRALCYCSRHETDGIFPAALLEDDAEIVGLMIAAEIFDAHDDEHHAVHDYLDWNRSKAEIENIREERRKAGSRGGKQSASKRQASCSTSAKGLLKHVEAKSNPKTETETETEETPVGVSHAAHYPRVCERIEQVTGNLLSDKDRTTVAGWCRIFSEPRIMAGIEKGAAKGKTRLAYIGTIIAEEPEPKTAKEPDFFADKTLG